MGAVSNGASASVVSCSIHEESIIPGLGLIVEVDRDVQIAACVREHVHFSNTVLLGLADKSCNVG
ncbi:hypothetical protein PENTCL1PPCAC_19848, partial [Pristionchus entomophagus]